MLSEYKLQNQTEIMYNRIPSSSIFYGLFRLFLCVVNDDEKTRSKNPILAKTEVNPYPNETIVFASSETNTIENQFLIRTC